MSIYKNSYEDAIETINTNWNSKRSKPLLFAKVKIKFGEKYMLDYISSKIPYNIILLENYISLIDDILEDYKKEDALTAQPQTEPSIIGSWQWKAHKYTFCNDNTGEYQNFSGRTKLSYQINGNVIEIFLEQRLSGSKQNERLYFELDKNNKMMTMINSKTRFPTYWDRIE